MSSVNEDLVEGKPVYLPQVGVVRDNQDPAGLRRVTCSIDGMVDETQWAYPVTIGGGSPQRGGHVVPAVGATVLVIFIGGNVERPVYSPLSWGDGAPAGTELPEDLQGLSPEDGPLVQTLELGRYKVTVDERPGREQLFIQDKLTEDLVQFDGSTGGIRVKATTTLMLQSDGNVVIDALAVTINGRPVLVDPKAI